jgi:hypothetical protein
MSQTQDEYAQLRAAGFTDSEIQEHLRPGLTNAGFSDQEINAYFNSYQLEKLAEPWEFYGDLTPFAQNFEEAGKDNFFLHGLQGSVSGLAVREKLPDAVSPEAMQDAGWKEHLSLGVGQMIGDIPALVGGGAIGAFGGPAAPVTIPAAAMAVTEGLRASYMDRIATGHTEDFFYLGGLLETLKATGKGGVVGAATGGAGVLAGKGLAAVGASAPVASIGRAAAEVAAMPTSAGALEGRLPHPQEFVDAALFIGVMRGVNGIRAVPGIVPKLRDIYTKLGKGPEEVARAAQEDQTVNQDILSVNRDVPETFIRDIERETIYNDSRSVKVEAVKTGEDFSLEDRPQLRAYLESINPEEVKALKYTEPDRYLAVLKDMVSELFPEGTELRFATKDGVYDYRHFLSDTTRQDYIATLPRTLKDSDVRVEFTTAEGAEKAYLIKKFFDPEIQKDIWDMLVIRDGTLITKIARKDRKGIDTADSTIRGAEREASQLATAAGDTESASTRATLPAMKDRASSKNVKPEDIDRAENRAAADGMTALLDGGHASPEMREMFAQDLRALRDLSRDRFNGFRRQIESAELFESPEET